MKQQESLKGLVGLLLAVEDSKQLLELLELFLTKEEIEMLKARYEIVRALLEGKLTQREIGEKYKVSIAQITRGSNALKIISPKLKKLLASFSW